jgi:hypothetical protein
METERSLPRPQQPTSCSYPETYQPTPHPRNRFKIHFSIVVSTLRSSEWSLSFRFRKKNCMLLSCFPYVPHCPHISLSPSYWFYRLNNIWCEIQVNVVNTAHSRVIGLPCDWLTTAPCRNMGECRIRRMFIWIFFLKIADTFTFQSSDLSSWITPCFFSAIYPIQVNE